ncbi:ZIP family metal transporter [Agrobacterium tumefaciens]|uniref:ZIP family metal transporter n=1 Tax=Agrobacterium tumefaciens TaxID=358 RepID=UPI001572F9F7|nr:metal transporter [Agrobacterium tumefaciens]WCK02880.1 metal transporter [Agrobacterium tumefaciens]
MNVMETKTTASARSGLALVWIALPLLALAAAIAWIFTADPLGRLDNGAPPVENLTFERTVLNDKGLQLLVRAGGSEPMTIAQVQVDAAYWTFTQSPSGEIPRGTSVWLNIDFPWNLADTHAVTVVTNTGASFDHEIAVAVPTPTATSGQLWIQTLVGIIVGVVPVAIGLMFYPALRNVGQGGMNFLLALTIGLLLYLLIDMTEEALEIAGETAALFQGRVMVVLGAFAAFLLLMAVGRRHGTPTGLALATYIALGIGLHNFGEGLAIGAAFAAGSAGLGAFLVLGFAIHNITEGIGIAAPILKKRPSISVFVGLTLLAGGPAVLGMWLGSLAYAPQWTAFALAIGAGAILQVIVEVAAYMARTNNREVASLFLSPAVLGGLGAGIVFMYATAALVKI